MQTIIQIESNNGLSQQKINYYDFEKKRNKVLMTIWCIEVALNQMKTIILLFQMFLNIIFPFNCLMQLFKMNADERLCRYSKIPGGSFKCCFSDKLIKQKHKCFKSI